VRAPCLLLLLVGSIHGRTHPLTFPFFVVRRHFFPVLLVWPPAIWSQPFPGFNGRLCSKLPGWFFKISPIFQFINSPFLMNRQGFVFFPAAKNCPLLAILPSRVQVIYPCVFELLLFPGRLWEEYASRCTPPGPLCRCDRLFPFLESVILLMYRQA